MAHPNEELITRFYTAFQNGDPETMASCYHEQARFQDPVFNLQGESVGNMWRMLLGKGGGKMQMNFSDVQGSEQGGSAKWEAKYPFSKSGREVHNKISSQFEFKDGLIVTQIDSFNFWKWTRMALGTTGLLLGWTPLVQNKVRAQAGGQLKEFEAQLAQNKGGK